MRRFYLVPVLSSGDGQMRGPAHFICRLNPAGLQCPWNGMDYGFMPSMLVLADTNEEQHAYLALQPDVYVFPPLEQLGNSLAPGDTLASFCESIRVPTNWITPATTYLQFLRCLAGIFQFAQRYYGISRQALLGEGVTLDTRYRNLTTQQQTWFDATVASFGYDPSITNPNATFRQMLKLVGDAWGNRVFYIGGVEF